MQIGDKVYYVRRRFSKYDVLELRLRTVEENCFVVVLRWQRMELTQSH